VNGNGDSAGDRARTLELIIRAALAEERLLARRLERVAEAQRRTREAIAVGRQEPLLSLWARQAGSSER
jgi:hypothetical protein